MHPQADIFESVFAFVLSRKCGNFKTEGRRTALISCVDYGQGVFCTHRDIPYLSKCGVSRRLFWSGFVRTFLQINEIQLHTFFLYITHYRGTDSKIGNFMFNQINLTMKKLFVLAALSIAAILPSCSDDYDDTTLRGRVDDLEDRVEQLETLCR